MKAIQLLALAATGLLTMNNSCHQNDTEEPCPDQEIAGTSPQFYPCITDRNGSDAKLFVVNSQQEFGDAFMCSSYRPRQSAFQDSTLLVGWKNYASCGHVKSQQVVYSCASNTYTYKVVIEAGVCQAAMPVTSQLLVPKLPAGAKVVIDMQ
jgi:hypothetical protein